MYFHPRDQQTLLWGRWGGDASRLWQKCSRMRYDMASVIFSEYRTTVEKGGESWADGSGFLLTAPSDPRPSITRDQITALFAITADGMPAVKQRRASISDAGPALSHRWHCRWDGSVSGEYVNDTTGQSGVASRASSSIQLSATGRLLDITYMCYEFRTPLFPAQLLQARQSDLSVTSIPPSVNRWRHNEYSCCSHPLLFVPASYTPVVKVRLVVWRSDLTGQGDRVWRSGNYEVLSILYNSSPIRPTALTGGYEVVSSLSQCFAVFVRIYTL